MALSGEPRVERTTSPDGFAVEQYYGKPFIRSVDDMIADLGVTVYPEDKLQIFPDPMLGLGGRITITRATPIWIDDGGKRTLVRTFSKTINDLFSEKGIILGAQDSVNPAPDTGVLAEGTVTITRVEETEVTEKQSIAFKTVTKEDPNLLEYTTKTEREGKPGSRELTYKVRRENGIEVSRTLLGSKVTAEPVEKIVLKGAKPLSIYQTGIASWYDHPRYNGYYAAHPTLAFGTRVLVKNSASPSKSVTVTIVDRGPWGAGRVIDLEPSAFQQLAPLGAGLVSVTLHVIP